MSDPSAIPAVISRRLTTPHIAIPIDHARDHNFTEIFQALLPHNVISVAHHLRLHRTITGNIPEGRDLIHSLRVVL